MLTHYQAALDAMVDRMRNSASGFGVLVTWLTEDTWHMDLSAAVEYGVIRVERKAELVAA